LLVLAGAGARELVRRWSNTAERPWLMACAAGLGTVAFHHLFDYLLASMAMMFVVVVVAGIALAIEPAGRPRAATPHLALAPALVLPLAVAAYALRGAALNDVGLTLAATGQWLAAAQAFERAAQAD